MRWNRSIGEPLDVGQDTWKQASTSWVGLLRQGEDLGSVVGDGDRVLVVCGPTACRTSEGPSVASITPSVYRRDLAGLRGG